MHKKYSFRFWTYSVGILILVSTSCTSTSRVHTLSQTCITALNNTNTLNFSFWSYCQQKLLFTDSIQLEAQLVDGQLVAGIKQPQACINAAITDQQATAIKTTLSAYFDGLNNLSNNKTVAYDIAPITNNFSSQNRPNWNMDETTVAAVNSVGNLLLNAIVGGYKNEKIKSYITKADPSITILIDKLVAYYALLHVQATNHSGNIVNYYAPFREDTNAYLKATAQKEMVHALQQTANNTATIAAIKALLNQIKTSHNLVSKQVNTTSKKDWYAFITQESSKIFASSKQLYYLIHKNEPHAAP